jgi:hypothetical protein
MPTEPAAVAEHLGMGIDLELGIFFVPVDRWERLQLLLSDLLQAKLGYGTAGGFFGRSSGEYAHGPGGGFRLFTDRLQGD